MNCSHAIFQQLGIARRKAEAQTRRSGTLPGISLRFNLAAMIFAFIAVTGVAHAGPVVTLPNALSYEYFGLNYADNIATSSTFGVLNYTGDPGCGGTCTATTALGSNPSVSLAVNEIEYNGGG